MGDINLQHLVYFSELARTLHYTEAARKLYISQPSLSYAISSLEKELGCTLFVKGSHNLKLSKEGAIFYKYVVKALEQLDAGREAVDDVIRSSSQVVSIAFIYTLARRSYRALPRPSRRRRGTGTSSSSLYTGTRRMFSPRSRARTSISRSAHMLRTSRMSSSSRTSIRSWC